MRPFYQFAIGCFALAGAISTPARLLGEDISFSREIRPILSDRCFLCHGPDSGQRASDLRLDDEQSALELAIVPGQPEASELIRRIFSEDADEVMPPPDSKLSLSLREKRLLQQWIEEGAGFQQHWAFVPPHNPVLPRLDELASDGNEIDSLVLSRMRAAGLWPNPVADRATLIRRLTLDITGLPPTIEEVNAFQADSDPNAYENLIDRLLANDRFGERMAVDWLDVARYADTYGYQNDRYRAMWPWRDWVVRAFNDNLPYDQFITWQIAGDLLPNATRDQILATAFNRNHRQTNEGGSVEEEFRSEYVADRVNTFGAAFLGLTLECCRCHDHKYDPITQRDYYQLSAFFNSIDESGLYPHFNEGVPTPTLELPTGEQAAECERAQSRVSQLEQQFAGWDFSDEKFRVWRQSLQDVRQTQDASADRESSLRGLLEQSLTQALIGDYPLESIDGDSVSNRADPQLDGKVHDDPSVERGKVGNGVVLDGENNIVFKTGGDFSRNQPFTISLWLKPAIEYERAVVLHRSRAWTDSGSRGYELLIEEGKLSGALVHFWPGNAIRIITQEPIPVGQWSHVSMVYDGSSRAGGLAIYIAGERAETTIVRDNLTKHIHGSDGFGGGETNELTIGQRFRDVGFKHGAVDEVRVFARDLSDLELKYVYVRDGLPNNVAEVLHNVGELPLRKYFATLDADRQQLLTQLKEARDERSRLVDSVPEIMVMRELPQPRPTYVLRRGAYDALGEAVQRGVPQEIFAGRMSESPDRLELAAWLVDPRHPLTARVAVNRFWQAIFGAGLVSTAEDFGRQGAAPSNPELLDWLAVRLVESDWNVKQLLKTIFMSATYRRQSDPTPHLLEHDPENQLLARGPAVRLSAEMIRDSALAAGGLLVESLGGPPVKPYQPDGLWEEKSGTPYVRDPNEGSHRRSLYTFWKRTSPPPAMMTFDASNREVCVVRRQVTMTPLQTLVLLNDPQYVEAARALAEKAMSCETSVGEQLQYVFQALTSRRATPAEQAVLERLYNEQLTSLGANIENAQRLLSVGDHRGAEALEPQPLAALCVVAQGLFSYDEFVMKR